MSREGEGGIVNFLCGGHGYLLEQPNDTKWTGKLFGLECFLKFGLDSD